MNSEIARRVPGHLAGLAEKRDRHLLFGAGNAIRDRDLLRFGGKIRHAKAFIEERIALNIKMHREVVLDGVANRHQPVRKPVSQTVAVEQRHHHIDVGFELDQPLARIGDRPLTNALEGHAILLLERARQRDKVVRVHLQRVGVAWITDELIAMPWNLAVDSARPVPLRRQADDDDRAAVLLVPILHGFERRKNLAVVIAIRQRQDIPAVGSPLVHKPVAIKFAVDHTAQKHVVDTRVVV